MRPESSGAGVAGCLIGRASKDTEPLSPHLHTDSTRNQSKTLIKSNQMVDLQLFSFCGVCAGVGLANTGTVVATLLTYMVFIFINAYPNEAIGSSTTRRTPKCY